jgi:catechol 2,3-dioxygenase-like lactoylglutathione lyase family enzyme
MPKVDFILETVLYVAELPRAATFYEDVMQFPCLFSDDRMRTHDVAGRGTLLLFLAGGTPDPVKTPFGTIPAHDAAGRQHIAFSVSRDALDAWRAHLARHDVAVESQVDWPRGGISLYFRDPDGHLLELATPGLWPGY